MRAGTLPGRIICGEEHCGQGGLTLAVHISPEVADYRCAVSELIG